MEDSGGALSSRDELRRTITALREWFYAFHPEAALEAVSVDDLVDSVGGNTISNNHCYRDTNTVS